MCTDGDRVPGSVADALRVAHAGLDYLNGPDAALLDPAALGGVLRSLGELQAKFAAAQAGFLRRFDAADAHDADGYGTSSAWLAAMTRLKNTDAKAAVAQMRTLGRHPHLSDAMAAGQISPSWVAEIDRLTRKLPAELRAETDQILLAAAAAGASLDDLKLLAACAVEQYLARQPSPDDDDDFDERFVQVGTTFGGASCVRGNLTPECTAAVQAVLDAMGKKRGPEDHRTVGQRFHDALQEACELLIRARMVPDRAGRGHPGDRPYPAVGAARLGRRVGAGGGVDRRAARRIWLPDRQGRRGRGLRRAHRPGGDRAPGHDGHRPDHRAGWPPPGTAQAIMAAATAPPAQPAEPLPATAARPPASRRRSRPARALPAEAWAALRYAIARLAIDFVSGPPGIAALLRTRLLQPPFTTASLPLDIGYSDSIPAHIRRAVALRDQGCAWPRCRRPASVCDVHHLVHKKDGGKTAVDSCVLLCQFHHDVCIHRWGWQLILHPDGTTEARGPNGQILRSHSPPTLRAG